MSSRRLTKGLDAEDHYSTRREANYSFNQACENARVKNAHRVCDCTVDSKAQEEQTKENKQCSSPLRRRRSVSCAACVASAIADKCERSFRRNDRICCAAAFGASRTDREFGSGGRRLTLEQRRARLRLSKNRDNASEDADGTCQTLQILGRKRN